MSFEAVGEFEENIVAFAPPVEKPKAEERTRTQIAIPNVQGNAAVAIDSVLINDSQIEQDIQEIQNAANRLQAPALSEVEMLQIKKLEIDAKVAAIQIKKEVEQEVVQMREQAQHEVASLREEVEAEIQNKREKLTEELSLENTKLSQLKKLQNDLEIKNNELEQVISHLEEDKQRYISQSESISQEIEQKKRFLEDLNSEFKSQKENLEAKKLFFDQELIKYEELIEKQKSEIKNEFKEKQIELTTQIDTYIEQIEKLKLEKLHFETGILDDQKYKEELQGKVKKLEDEKSGIKSEFDKIQLRVDDLYNEKQEVQNQIKEVEKDKKILVEEIEVLTLQRQELKEKLALKEEELYAIHEEIETQIEAGRRKIDEELNSIRNEREKEIEELIESATLEASEIQAKAHNEYKIAEENRLESEKEISHRVEAALEEYEKTVMQAKEKKDQILEQAQNKSTQLVTQAQEKATSLIESAQAKALELHQNSLKELEATRKDLDDKISHAKSILEENHEAIEKSQLDLNQLQEKIKTERQVALDEIEKDRVEILAEAKKQAKIELEETRSRVAKELDDLKLEQEKIKADTSSELEKLRKIEAIKLETLKKDETENLNQLRAQALEQISSDKEKARKEIELWKKKSVADISMNIENLVTLKLKKMSGKELSAKEITLEATSIREIVEATLSGGQKAQSSVLDLLNPYSSFGRGKSRDFMIKIGVGAFFGIVLLMLMITQPKWLTDLVSSAGEALEVEKSAQQMFSEELKQARDNRPVFDPKLTPGFKATLTENVLYTEEFINIWTSADFQREWGLKADNTMIYKMRLKGVQVEKYLNLELKTIKELQNMRKSITLAKQEEKIKEMFDYEFKREEELKELVGGEENYSDLLDLREEFFNNFINKTE